MKTFQSKKKLHRILQSKLTLGLMLIAIVLLLLSCLDLYKKKRLVTKLRDVAQTEYQTTVSKNTTINADLEKINSAYGREKLIREKYNVKKEGEQVIIVTESDAGTDNAPIVNKSIFERITDYLSRYF